MRPIKHIHLDYEILYNALISLVVVMLPVRLRKCKISQLIRKRLR